MNALMRDAAMRSRPGRQRGSDVIGSVLPFLVGR
jgi:hypothetical protein